MLKALPSAIEEDALAEEQHGNIHHNIAQSRCGSDHEENLSTVSVSRHNRLHYLYFNALPTEIARSMAIFGVGMKGPGRLDPGQMNCVLRMLRGSRLQHYVSPQTLVCAADMNGAVRSLQNARATMHMLAQEQGFTRETIDALMKPSCPFPHEIDSYLEDSMGFFDARSSSEAIANLFTEKQNGEYAWTKPLKYQVRDRVVRVLETPSSVTYTENDYRNFLETHHRILETRIGDHKKHLKSTHRALSGLMSLYAPKREEDPDLS